MGHADQRPGQEAKAAMGAGTLKMLADRGYFSGKEILFSGKEILFSGKEILACDQPPPILAPSSPQPPQARRVCHD